MSLLSRLAVQAARAYGILSSDKNRVIADYLVVAGGGGGSSGGGGGGGLLTSTATLSTLNTYSITVGAGGTAGIDYTGVAGGNGGNSVISGTGLSTITSYGGGGGAAHPGNGVSGGSGGGAGHENGSTVYTGGSATSGQGYAGGNSARQASGGGGGAGSVGGNGTNPSNSASGGIGGNGGNGAASSISGSSVTYAGGGGGYGYNTGVGSGGTGGGGAASATVSGTSGTANLGGGGGAGVGASYTGGAGGSGIVIISYTSATPKFVGGTITTSGGKQIHTFTSSGTLSPITPITASYLVVAGGGGGALGGGGAGGLQTGSTTIYSGATYVVTVGGGGTAGTVTSTNGGQGNNSVLSGTGLTTLTSIGGGYGGSSGGVNGGNGGSGGGGGSGNAGGTATSGQGNNGGAGIPLNASPYSGGGGGGAGATGGTGSSSAGGSGGNGSASSITGTSVTYAGGGGGGVYLGGYSGGTAGTGGGGAGASGAAGSSGTPNLGGGGGGAGNTFNGGAGGSGVVIISYAGSQVFNGGLVTSSGGNTIHTFTSTGALTPLTNNLNNSLRFRSSASAYLQRTPTVTGSLTTWTASCWYKNGVMNTNETLFSNAVASDSIGFRSGRVIEIYFGAGSANLVTTQVFRDPAAWYHIVVAVDTTQATAANRIKLYVNGNQVTAFSTATYPSQNYQTSFNRSGYNQEIGRRSSDGAYPIDGYFADINWVDGQALEPYYFGNNDANGVWKPIQYKGTYGTNGFYLTFGNTTSTTTLGYDSSPNGNNWTCNNISLTAGTTYDAMTDVPTNTSATVANYAVLNPLDNTAVLSEANLKITYTGAATWHGARGSIYVSSGKYYWEVNVVQVGYLMIGVASPSFSLDNTYGSNTYNWTYFQPNGNKYGPGIGGSGSAYGASYTTGDVIGVALDMDAGTLTFYKNNTSQGTAFTGITGLVAPVIALDNETGSGGIAAANFGQRPFSYSVPTGFVALNTYNLPTPTILQGNKYMDATLYTGTGTSQVTVNAGQFKPDFVWLKSRSNAYNNELYDSVRGVQKRLVSNLTNAESTSTNGLTAFNSNGFTQGGEYETGLSGNYVGWQWQAGQGTTSSNTSGSITSTVSVNTTAGFSIVTYTGTGANATVGHGLGVAPKMVIVKRRNSTGNWPVYHVGLTSAGYVIYMNLTNAQAANATAWNSTAPTSSVFSIGTDTDENTNTGTYVAYCWAEIAGFSKFGSYTGNGSADGPFIYLGFRPKYIMVKRYSSSAGNAWCVWDSARETYNVENAIITVNTSNAENTGTLYADFLSNGFKLRSYANGSENANGESYIYACWAEHPFKNSNAR